MLDREKQPKTFQEPPELAELVKAGKLPPVAERIGADPLVVKPVHGIGRYGGTMRRGFTGPVDVQNANRLAAGPDNLLYFDWRWQKVVPNLAKGWEVSADGRATTIFLRKGMKWSDGHPFMADDILFWHDDIYRDEEVFKSPHPHLVVNGKPAVVKKVDDFTVRFEFDGPYYLFPEVLAGWTAMGGQSLQGSAGLGGYAPKHYLMQFHPKYVSKEELDRKVRESGQTTWVSLLKAKNSWHLNPELPTLTPWKTVQPINTANWVLERNPYSIWVDTEGNQLPYIDRISMTLAQDTEVLNLRTVAGEYDFQERHVDMQKLPVLLQNQERSGYRVFVDPGQNGGDFYIRINLSYEADPEIGELLRNPDFRRALSLGIKREQINEAFFLGLGTPSSPVPADDNKYFPGQEYRTLWATYDPGKANAMLDALGLDRRDAEGYRLRKDGKGRLRLKYTAVAASNANYTAMGEMVREHWKEIGIDLDVESIEGTLAIQRALANELQLAGINNSGSEDLFIFPEAVLPFSTTAYPAGIGILYARWFHSGGREGKEPPQRIRQALELWRRGLSAPDAERIAIGKEIWKIVAEDVFGIGVIGMGPALNGVRVASRKLDNVPARIINATAVKSPSNALPQTFYFKA